MIRVLVVLAAVAQGFRHRNASERVAAFAARTARNQTKEMVSPQPKEGTLEACRRQMVENLQTPAMQSFSKNCEDTGHYSKRVVDALQKDDRKMAFTEATELFEKCGKLSKTCAERMAPGLVEEVRLSGMTVSDECRAQTEKFQRDKEHLEAAAECDKKAKFSEKVMASLEKEDLPTAVDTTKESLTTCMKLSKKCAHEVAPILVNSVVLRAMQEAAMEEAMEAQQVPILVVEQPVVMVVREGKDMSLLGKFMTQTSSSVHKSPSFLQKDAKILPRVSKLVLQLALQTA